MTIVKYFRPNCFSFNGNEDDYADNKTFSDLFFRTRMEHPANKMPEANVYESSEAFRIETALPGIRKSNVKIRLEKGILSITTDQQENIEGKVTLNEFNHNEGKRSFILPDSINTEKISSQLENGILTILLPKKESSIPKGPTDIQIN